MAAASLTTQCLRQEKTRTIEIFIRYGIHDLVEECDVRQLLPTCSLAAIAAHYRNHEPFYKVLWYVVILLCPRSPFLDWNQHSIPSSADDKSSKYCSVSMAHRNR